MIAPRRCVPVVKSAIGESASSWTPSFRMKHAFFVRQESKPSGLRLGCRQRSGSGVVLSPANCDAEWNLCKKNHKCIQRLRYCRSSYFFGGMGGEVAKIGGFGRSWKYQNSRTFLTKRTMKDKTDLTASLLEGFPRFCDLWRKMEPIAIILKKNLPWRGC